MEARYGPESDGLKDAALERRRENRRKDLSQTILKTAVSLGGVFSFPVLLGVAGLVADLDDFSQLALQSIQPSVAIAPMEPQLRGPWREYD